MLSEPLRIQRDQLQQLHRRISALVLLDAIPGLSWIYMAYRPITRPLPIKQTS